MTHSDYINAVGQANYYSHMYYVASAPVVSDAEFDALVAQIEQYERLNPSHILPDSPTQQVGSDLNGNGRIAHRTPMLSCQKAQDIEKVASWITKTNQRMNVLTGDNHYTGGYKLVAMWKYDGISCSLVYQDGQLISAATRGDGRVGQDITAHALCIPSIPQQLRETGATFSLKGRIEVRGEIVCSKRNLQLLSTRYTDCRTAASSLCNQSVPDAIDLAMLDFIPWDAYIDDAISCQIQFSCTPLGYPWHKFDFLHRLCFIHRPETLSAHSFDEAKRIISDFESRRADFEFPVDGVVFRIMHDDYFRALGATSHHPHGSIAYKFAPAKTQTVCRRVEVTIGKTGKRTPVAYFDSVTILGREVHSASLYSEKSAADLGIYPGATIEVGLSNDITPKVYRVIAPAQHQASTVSPDSTIPSASQQSSVGDKVTENDPFAGIDFPGEETPVAHDLFAATPVDDSVLGDSVAEEEEEPWLAPSLFSEEPATVSDAPATVPDASPSGSTAPTVLGDSVAENETPSHSHHRTAAILGTVVCAALLCCVGAVAMAAAVFFVPILAGTLRV